MPRKRQREDEKEGGQMMQREWGRTTAARKTQVRKTQEIHVGERKFMLSSQLQHMKNGGDDDEVNINYQCQF